MPAGTLLLKIGAPLNMRRSTLDELLKTRARECNQARIHIAEKYAEFVRTREGDERKKYWLPVAAGGLGTIPYNTARRVVPAVNSHMISTCQQEIVKKLKAKTPRDYTGTARWVWEGIAKWELPVPFFRKFYIPAPVKSTAFCYCGERSTDISTLVDAKLAEYGKSSAVLRFAHSSRESGWRDVAAVVRLEVRQQSHGVRRLLQRMARREIKICDSQIIQRSDGEWYFALCYDVDKDANLNKDRVAVLRLNYEKERSPFVLELPADSAEKNNKVFVGFGLAYHAETERVIKRRMAIRSTHRLGAGVGGGHGWHRFYRILRPLSHRIKDIQDRFVKTLVADVMKQCRLHDCGTVVYWEPNMPTRDRSWFSSRKCTMDWTKVEAALKWKCQGLHIEYECRETSLPEYRKAWGQDDDKNATLKVRRVRRTNKGDKKAIRGTNSSPATSDLYN